MYVNTWFDTVEGKNFVDLAKRFMVSMLEKEQKEELTKAKDNEFASVEETSSFMAEFFKRHPVARENYFSDEYFI